MNEQEAIAFLSDKGYACLKNQSSPSFGMSARRPRTMAVPTTTQTVVEYMADPAHKAEIDQKLADVGIKSVKKGGKKRSHKKRSHKKRS